MRHDNRRIIELLGFRCTMLRHNSKFSCRSCQQCREDVVEALYDNISQDSEIELFYCFHSFKGLEHLHGAASLDPPLPTPPPPHGYPALHPHM